MHARVPYKLYQQLVEGEVAMSKLQETRKVVRVTLVHLILKDILRNRQ